MHYWLASDLCFCTLFWSVTQSPKNQDFLAWECIFQKMLAGVATCFWLFGRGLGKKTGSIRGMAIFPRQLTDAVKNQVHAQEARLHSSAFHTLLSANLSERISTAIGRFGAHQQSHPNTIWWKQETLGAVCASGFGKWAVISPAVLAKCCLLPFCQRIMRKGKIH